MDPKTDEHEKAREALLSLDEWAINATVVHEVYHALAFKRGMSPRDAKSKLDALIRDRRTSFLNTTRTISLYSLDLASEFGMGGRDSLIVGSFMHNGIDAMLTRDRDLLGLKKLRFRGQEIVFTDPLAA